MSRQTDIAEFVHRANVAKYLKILATYLTPHEREFVEQRLAEERAGLEQLCFTGGESDRKLAC
jgi:hypothetical protein